MYLGIDYGKKKVGIAVGESIAFSRGFYNNNQELFGKIVELIKGEEISVVVLGLPVKDSGQEGELAEEIRRFGQKLAANTSAEIVYENESDTSFASHQELKNAGIDIRSAKTEVDGLAAEKILQQYIDSSKFRSQISK